MSHSDDFYIWDIVQDDNVWVIVGLNCNVDYSNTYYTAEYCSRTYDDSVDYVGCKNNRCPANNWIVSVLLAFYALLTVIMLLNVLIAIFKYVKVVKVTISFHTLSYAHMTWHSFQSFSKTSSCFKIWRNFLELPVCDEIFMLLAMFKYIKTCANILFQTD